MQDSAFKITGQGQVFGHVPLECRMYHFAKSGVPTLRRNREVGVASYQQPEQILMQIIIAINLEIGQNAIGIQM